MTRELLLEKICPAGCTNDCVSLDCNRHCYEILNKFLDEYDKHIIEQYKTNTKIKDTIREIHDNVAQEMYCKGVDDLVEGLKEYFVIPHDVRVIEMTAEQLKENK